jgi:ATP/maltotriose-dependent transcriptional regulator MalT
VAVDPLPGASLIERPRLLERLDDFGGRVIVLAAPAGYGKTVLAAQWLGGRDDVAWRSARVDGCREIVAAALAPGPDAWLVVDDYEALTHGDERFVRLLERTRGRVLVASRRRPAWLSARRLIHGEAVELRAADLAFTEAEAAEALRRRACGPEMALVQAARGWPAVVALAARARSEVGGLRRELERYFAEEVFGLEPALLEQLAVAGALLDHLENGGPPRPPQPARGAARLTPREHEVLDLMSQGLGNAEIASRLFISEKTAKTHVTHLFEKLGVRSRVQAVIAAGRTGRPGAAIAGSA